LKKKQDVSHKHLAKVPITTHGLALLIGEGIQSSISLEVVTILLHGLLPHSKNGVNTNKNLDVELPSLQQ
jgi:hypothetical protein